MLKRLAVAAAGLAVAAAPLLGVASSANASIVGDPVYTGPSVGVAGEYVAPNANQQANGDHVTGARMTHYLRTIQEVGYPDGLYPTLPSLLSTIPLDPSSNLNKAPEIGPELCQFYSVGSFGQKVVEFTQYIGHNTFGVYEGSGTGACDHGTSDMSGSATLIDYIPAGHTAFQAITESASHIFTFTDEDLTTGTGPNTDPLGGFLWSANRAGWGTAADASSITAPANLKLAAITSAAARDNKGWTVYDRANLTRLNAVSVICTSTGTSAGQPLIQPVLPLSGKGNLTLMVGNQSN